MSALRLFAPVELQLFPGDDFSGPAIFPVGDNDEMAVIPFPAARRQGTWGPTGTTPRPVARRTSESVAAQTPLDRARLLHTHRCCPDCGRGGTVPREAADLQAVCLSMPVPGTSTLLGFGCHHCGHEWSV